MKLKQLIDSKVGAYNEMVKSLGGANPISGRENLSEIRQYIREEQSILTKVRDIIRQFYIECSHLQIQAGETIPELDKYVTVLQNFKNNVGQHVTENAAFQLQSMQEFQLKLLNQIEDKHHAVYSGADMFEDMLIHKKLMAMFAHSLNEESNKASELMNSLSVVVDASKVWSHKRSKYTIMLKHAMEKAGHVAKLSSKPAVVAGEFTVKTAGKWALAILGASALGGIMAVLGFSAVAATLATTVHIMAVGIEDLEAIGEMPEQFHNLKKYMRRYRKDAQDNLAA